MRLVTFSLAVLMAAGSFALAPVMASVELDYVYDATGNLIQGDGKYYEYNDANRLVRVRHRDASGPVIAEYVYDANGQRVKKVENGVTTYYIGKHSEKEISAETERDTNYFFYEGKRLSKREGVDSLVFYHSDHLESVIALSDLPGVVRTQGKYYPYGMADEKISDKFGYSGKEFDRVSSFSYFGQRYYAPSLRHFSQADTVSLDPYDPQAINRYAFVTNNPLRFVDPNGRWRRDTLNTMGLNLWKMTANTFSIFGKASAAAGVFASAAGGAAVGCASCAAQLPAVGVALTVGALSDFHDAAKEAQAAGENFLRAKRNQPAVSSEDKMGIVPDSVSQKLADTNVGGILTGALEANQLVGSLFFNPSVSVWSIVEDMSLFGDIILDDRHDDFRIDGDFKKELIESATQESRKMPRGGSRRGRGP